RALESRDTPTRACGAPRARRDADQRVHGIPQRIDAGNLVGKEFDEAHETRGREHQRMRERREPRRKVDPAEETRCADDEKHRVEAKPAREAEGGGDGDELPRVEMLEGG